MSRFSSSVLALAALLISPSYALASECCGTDPAWGDPVAVWEQWGGLMCDYERCSWVDGAERCQAKTEYWSGCGIDDSPPDKEPEPGQGESGLTSPKKAKGVA